MKTRLTLVLFLLLGCIATSALLPAQTLATTNSSSRLDAQSAERGTSVRPPPAYGTTEYSVTSVSAGAFNGIGSLDPISTTNNGYRYFTGGARDFIGSVGVPSGVTIDYIGLNNCDAAGGNFTFALLDGTAGSGGNLVQVGSITTTSNSCAVQYNASALGYSYVANAGHNLVISVVQDIGAPTNGSAGVMSVEVWWHRQVSPGPATATFSDVPTNHPFFKFVEALHAAGITGGYPDGRFGVNDPITRGQMAVFLSAALGLNWPN